MYASDTAATQDIKKSSVLKNLDVVWQHVVESNVPPSDANLVIGTCLITGKTNAPCIVIRGKGRGAQNFTVCSKFASFLYHLWIVYKIDILIKVRRVCPPWGAVSDALRRFTPAGPWRRWTPRASCRSRTLAKKSRSATTICAASPATCTLPTPMSTGLPRGGFWLWSRHINAAAFHLICAAFHLSCAAFHLSGAAFHLSGAAF